MKTLQEQYNLLKEGKGHADVFLKSARRLFPEYVTNFATTDEAVKILKQKSIITEGVGGIVTANPFTSFENFLQEEAKAVEKKTTKEVEEMETAGFDYKDPKNIDNLFGEQFLKGYYAEMKDPKNADKSVEDLKEIVAKNLAKDRNYYVKNAAFGVKEIGYTDEAVALAASKSDQMEEVKESVETEAEVITEAKSTVDSKLSEIEKAGKIVTLEAQIGAVEEVIESKNQRLEMLGEDADLAELMDKKKIKAMQKEIKLLEKKRDKMMKMYEKMCGKSYSKPEMVDESAEEEIKENSDSKSETYWCDICDMETTIDDENPYGTCYCS